MAVLRADPDVMESLHLPEGLDRDTVTDNIVMETAELSLVYSRPDVFRKMLDIWSRRKLPVWTALYETLLYDYDPISNYDRWEESVHRDDHESSSQGSGSFNSSGNYRESGENSERFNRNGSHSGTETENTHHNDTASGHRETDTTGNSTLTHNVWGFNITEPMPAHQDVTESKAHEGETSGTTSAGDINRTLDSGGTDADSGGTHSDSTLVNTHGERGGDKNARSGQEVNFSAGKSHMYGNIGVTTTQQMIQQERDIAQFNITETIIQDFKKQFCIGIYQ